MRTNQECLLNEKPRHQGSMTDPVAAEQVKLNNTEHQGQQQPPLYVRLRRVASFARAGSIHWLTKQVRNFLLLKFSVAIEKAIRQCGIRDRCNLVTLAMFDVPHGYRHTLQFDRQ